MGSFLIKNDMPRQCPSSAAGCGSSSVELEIETPARTSADKTWELR